MEQNKVFKINSSLIKKIKSIIRCNSIEYPSIKNFIEKAVLKQIKKLKGKKNGE